MTSDVVDPDILAGAEVLKLQVRKVLVQYGLTDPMLLRRLTVESGVGLAGELVLRLTGHVWAERKGERRVQRMDEIPGSVWAGLWVNLPRWLQRVADKLVGPPRMMSLPTILVDEYTVAPCVAAWQSPHATDERNLCQRALGHAMTTLYRHMEMEGYDKVAAHVDEILAGLKTSYPYRPNTTPLPLRETGDDPSVRLPVAAKGKAVSFAGRAKVRRPSAK